MTVAQATARSSSTTGILFILVAAAGYGLLPVLTRAADALGLPVELMQVMRFIGPALLFLPWLHRTAREPRIAAQLFLAGIFIGAGTYGYLNALVVLDVATAALIFFTFPLFTIAFAAMFAGVLPTPREGIAVLIIVLAAFVILNPQSIAPDRLPTIAVAFSTPIAYGFLLETLSRVGLNYGIKSRSAPIALGAVLGALPLLVKAGGLAQVTFDANIGLVLFAQLTVAGLIPQLALVAGACRTGPALAAIVASSELVVAIASGWTILGEPVEARAVIGAAMILTAIALAATARR